MSLAGALLILVSPVLGWSQEKPADLVVTPQEKAMYLEHNQTVVDVASQCIQETYKTHIAFFNKYGISKYYGDRNPSLNTREKRLAVIKSVGAPASIIDQLEGISCIGLTRKCLKQGFEATQNPLMSALWSRLDQNLISRGTDGLVLTQHLQKLGWKILYWNPRPDLNAEWDAEDPMIMAGKPVSWDSGIRNSQGQFIYHPAWGMHGMRYNQVMKKDVYYNVKVDDKTTLVNFDIELPQAFIDNAFFVGVAHAGYHVFPGSFGQVIEAHSMRRLDSIDNLEKGQFNPLAVGGAPQWTKIEKYRSGIVAIPPK
ncbi:hypothetical protein DOM22_12650 [Bdellovibrio sp. ZAP7]|uniref:hypothetical protein n=1 Tax=Bdellovibrio sp. ZAP7 TaxID=2231053 RepID=UPI0011580377|nr:hypothetical protein [Bdellovibrio sp. ZAP7]QDK45940.1 hypothetical protein DOM22_12650 [Bdellovibrio sp. ZAP7]